MSVDNYDLSNLLLLADCAGNRERYPRLTDEQNRRATFSRRSVIVSTTEQAEQQQLPSTGNEQIPGQRVLADFDILLASSIPAPLIVDEPVVDEPEDPFTALAAYHPRTFDDDTQQPLESNLGLLGNSNTSEAVLAEPDGNDVHEPPEQSQGESDAKGISILESANPDKRTGQRRAPEPKPALIRGIPKSFIEDSINVHIQESLRRSKKLTRRRQGLDSTETEIVPLPQEVVTRNHSVAVPEKSANSPKNAGQDTGESLWEQVEKETEKWIVVRKGIGRRYVCNYPICGFSCTRLGDLKKHIFIHTRISIFKCAYPECANKPYFRDRNHLRRHLRTNHTHEQPFHCTICDKRFGRMDNYKRHMRNIHKITV